MLLGALEKHNSSENTSIFRIPYIERKVEGFVGEGPKPTPQDVPDQQHR